MKYIGMDMHKTSTMVAVLDEDGHCLSPFRIPSSAEDLVSLAGQIERPAKVAIEATRNHSFFYDLLRNEGLLVTVSHPKHTEAIASSKKKSDRHDARTLAKLLKAELLTESFVPELDIRLLRESVREYRRLGSAKTRAKNWIRSTLAQEGLICNYRDIFGKSAKAWLSTVQMHPVRKLSIERNLDLIYTLSQQIEQVRQQIIDMIKHHPDTELLTSIPGVGYITAAAMIAEIAGISRFRSDRELASYAGLVTTTRESAGVVKHGHITKEGSATLRWAFTMATSHLIRKPCPLKSFYDRLKEKHGKKSARTAAARKLLRYVFAILTSRKAYDPNMAVQRGLECVTGQPPIRVGQAR